MARRSGFTHRSQPRRQTSWALGPEASAQNVSASTTQIWTVATVPVIEGLTIVRTRGFIRILLTTVLAADSGFSGAFGIGVTNQNAVGKSASSGHSCILLLRDSRRADDQLSARSTRCVLDRT